MAHLSDRALFRETLGIGTASQLDAEVPRQVQRAQCPARYDGLRLCRPSMGGV